MNANKDMEKLYELLEKFDFRDLSEEDRNYVLTVATIEEYDALRSTLRDTEILFSNDHEIELSESIYDSLINVKNKTNGIIQFLNKPVRLYKVAAAIILLTGLFSFIHFSNLHEQNRNSLSNDTIYIYKTDTIYSRIVDTVKQIKERVVYITQKKETESTHLLMTARNDYDSISSNDFDRIKSLVYNNNVSNDTMIKN